MFEISRNSNFIVATEIEDLIPQVGVCLLSGVPGRALAFHHNLLDLVTFGSIGTSDYNS
jgi:hypothetical protein